MTIYDRIFELEGKLDKPDLNFLERRLLLRAAFGEIRAEALAEGHREGMHDANDAHRAEGQSR